MLGPGNHDHVNDKFVDETEVWLRHELKAMENNEILDKDGKDNKWDTQPFQPRIHKATPEPPTQRNVGGWNGAWNGAWDNNRRKRFACYTHLKWGQCNKRDCPFSHDPNTWTVYDPNKAQNRQPQETGANPPTATINQAVVQVTVPIKEMARHCGKGE